MLCSNFLLCKGNSTASAYVNNLPQTEHMGLADQMVNDIFKIVLIMAPDTGFVSETTVAHIARQPIALRSSPRFRFSVELGGHDDITSNALHAAADILVRVQGMTPGSRL